MDRIFIVTLISITLIAIITAIAYYQKYKKALKNIDEMLEDAIRGEFLESKFDESMMSAIEGKFSKYLSSSSTLSQKITDEKDTIKELISDISHQTKTPLANILLYMELIEETELTDDGKEYLNALKNQTGKLKFLIDTLVKVSRLETGVFNMNLKKQELYPIIEDLIYTFDEKAKAKNISVIFEKSFESGIFDKKWLSEALSNILDNAIKYTDENGKISIKIIPYEIFLRIDIEDNGVGINENELEKIFGRFYRGRNVSDEEGIGVGLYLTREILSRQGAYIKVTSKINKGTVFSVFLQRN